MVLEILEYPDKRLFERSVEVDKFGQLLGAKASLIGGIVLVAIGVKTFVQNIFFGG